MPAYKRIALWLLAGMMITIGVQHFANPDPFVRIMPPYLPNHRGLVYVSGAFEILGGFGLLVPRVRGLAAWGLIALYICVFPANVHMALNQIQLEPGGNIPKWAMWARLPVQAVFIAWAWWFTKPQRAYLRQ